MRYGRVTVVVVPCTSNLGMEYGDDGYGVYRNGDGAVGLWGML